MRIHGGFFRYDNYNTYIKNVQDSVRQLSFFTKMTMKNIIIGILGARLDHAGLAAGMLATWYLVIDAREFSGG